MLQVHDQDVVTYAGFALDPFQTEAIRHLDSGHSVIVSAPTGVGKTLVADYLIERCVRRGERIVYTAPIKALSNQKYKEFKQQFGSDVVGILTGDVVVNPDAPVLIMTTEIFRNMLLTDARRVYGTSYVILDEVHFIADEERGSVWEESLIFMPKEMRFLGLSATIPNVLELAEWASSIRSDEVRVVTHLDRIVPLTHMVYEKGMGLGSADDLLLYRDRVMKAAQKREQETGVFLDARALFPDTTHLDLVDAIRREYLPCLYFVFSRKQCELKAAELAEHLDFLSAAEAKAVAETFDARMTGLGAQHTTATKRIREVLVRGVGVHHAGLLPAVKEVVEELFERRLVKVLYCTETFSVGINMPVKAVCFDSWQKYDGVQFRDLSAQEYFQMSGRAGRRGIDTEGYAFTMVNMRYFNQEQFPDFAAGGVEDLRSRFRLSYNTVLNLVSAYTDENIRRILEENFAIFQLKARRRRILAALAVKEQQEIQLMASVCECAKTVACPIEFHKLERELAETKSKLRFIPKKAWRRKKVLQRQLAEAQLRMHPMSPKHCEVHVETSCGHALRLSAALHEEIRGLRKEASELDPVTLFHQHFEAMVGVLKTLDYIGHDGTLAPRGLIASELHVQELLVTELIFSGVLAGLDVPELAALCVSIDYVPRKEEHYNRPPFSDYDVLRLVEYLAEAEMGALGAVTVVFNTHAAKLAYMWAAGCTFPELMRRTQVAEGDVVIAFRRTIDLMRQIRAACRQDEGLCERLSEAIDVMDRDVVRVDL